MTSQATASGVRRLALTPRDGFYANDGRGWGAGGRGYAVEWPWPTTIRGALTTASGKVADKKRPEPFSGAEWRAHRDAVRIERIIALRARLGEQMRAQHRMWPVPLDSLWLESCATVFRLDPTLPDPAEIPVALLGRKSDGIAAAMERLWRPRNLTSRAKPLSAPRWWDDATFFRWLEAKEPVPTDPNVAPPKQWPGMHRRVQSHVGIQPDTLTAEESILYQHEVLETLAVQDHSAEHERRRDVFSWTIGVQATTPNSFDVARLGGDSRLAFVDAELSADIFECPKTLLAAFDELKPTGMRIVATSTAHFSRGWIPDGFEPTSSHEFHGETAGLSKLVLRAAFVPRPLHLSGWEMAPETITEENKKRGGAPRRTERLVAPGAVFFVTKADGTRFTSADALRVWNTPVGKNADGTGFGRVVPGIWKVKV